MVNSDGLKCLAAPPRSILLWISGLAVCDPSLYCYICPALGRESRLPSQVLYVHYGQEGMGTRPLHVSLAAGTRILLIDGHLLPSLLLFPIIWFNTSLLASEYKNADQVKGKWGINDRFLNKRHFLQKVFLEHFKTSLFWPRTMPWVF